MYANCSQKLQIVEEFVKLGWKVFPVHCIENGSCSCGKVDCDQGKHPLTPHGFKDATSDSETLKQWFSGKYEGVNIGLATGKVSGVSVLDVDGEEGLKTLKELEERYGSFPNTVKQQTGSGVGSQYLFAHDPRWDGKTNRVKFLPGLDIRTTGGYVLLPPSNHKSGNHYQWLVSPQDSPLLPAPDWLLDLIPNRKVEKVERARTIEDRVVLYFEKTPPAISGSGGQGTTFSTCCRLVELFPEVSEDDLFDSMSDWNQRCDPAWSEKELRKKIKDARKKIGVPQQSTEDSTEGATDTTEIDSETIGDGYPVISGEAYHGLVGEILRTLDPITEADPASILMMFLTSFGVAVGRSPHFLVEGTKHHANLFSVIVGRSSRARKGTSQGRVLELMAGISCSRDSGLSTGEGLINRVRDESPGRPGIKDKRLWIIESEFSRCLSVMRREGNTLSAILRDAWDAGNISVLTRVNELSATDVHIGITAHITEEELKKTLKEVDAHNGFGNRFLWTAVRRSKLLPDGGDCDLSHLQKKITEAFDIAKKIERMTRSTECSLLWKKVYPILGAEKCGVWDAMTARAEAQVVRLSLLYALLDGSSTIEVDHLNAALAVWDYCDQSAKLLFDDPDSIQNKILEFVNKKPGVNKTEVRLSFGHGPNTGAKFEAALKSLITRGEIIAVPVYEKRQSTTLYPAVRFKTSLPDTLIPDSRSENTVQPSGGVTPATAVDVFEWKNANEIEFEVRERGEVWVTLEFESKLTPAIEEFIKRNQSIVSSFVVAKKISEPVAEAVADPDELLTDEDWNREMAEM